MRPARHMRETTPATAYRVKKLNRSPPYCQVRMTKLTLSPWHPQTLYQEGEEVPHAPCSRGTGPLYADAYVSGLSPLEDSTVHCGKLSSTAGMWMGSCPQPSVSKSS